jgi:hypothetical protein
MCKKSLKSEWVSDCHFTSIQQFFQLYHGENKLIVNEMMMMRSALFYYNIGIGCFSVRYAALRRKRQSLVGSESENVPEWSDMSTRGLLFQ